MTELAKAIKSTFAQHDHWCNECRSYHPAEDMETIVLDFGDFEEEYQYCVFCACNKLHEFRNDSDGLYSVSLKNKER